MRLLRMFKSPAFWVIALSLTIAAVVNVGEQSGLLSNAGSSANADERPSLVKMASEISILREGADLAELKGQFRKTGDRYHFFEDGGNVNYKCLENLCLQRIVATIKNEDRKPVWIISAKVTEFEDENFLLLEKATRTR